MEKLMYVARSMRGRLAISLESLLLRGEGDLIEQL
jgi:hypothetical protein